MVHSVEGNMFRIPAMLFVLPFIWIKLISAVEIQIVPSQVLLASKSPYKTSVKCTPIGTHEIAEISSIQINRKRGIDVEYVTLAEVLPDKPPALVDTINETAPDVGDRNPFLNGMIYVSVPSFSFLEMELYTSGGITCEDTGEYQCQIVYNDTSNISHTVTETSHLNVNGLPSDLSLTVLKGGFQVTGGTVSNPAVFRVGEIAQISCTGNTGGASTRIRWRITRPSGNYTLVEYYPPRGTLSDTEETGSSGCTYRRTATIDYRVTDADAIRDNRLVFQCYIAVRTQNRRHYEIPNPPMLYIDVPFVPVEMNAVCNCKYGDAVIVCLGSVIVFLLVTQAYSALRILQLKNINKESK